MFPMQIVHKEIENIHARARFGSKSDRKIGTMAQNTGGVGAPNSRVVGKTSEMDSLVALRMLINFLGQRTRNIGHSPI